MKYLSTLLLIATLISCSKTNEIEEPEYIDLSVYVDRFVQEAKDRGFDFDLSQLEAEYVDEIAYGQSLCGYGFSNYDGNGKRRVEISKSEGCNWKERSDIERENLFFHELGHAFLNRFHDETQLCDGRPLTLMASDWNSWQIYRESETERRDYYITELIDRLSAADQCIRYGKDWSVDSVFYQDSKSDTAWYFYSDNQNYSGVREVSDADPEKFNFTIGQISGTNPVNTGYWLRQFNDPNIPECASVKLKVTMSSDDLSGAGVAIAIRAYEAPPQKFGAVTEEYLVLSTENVKPITGALESETHELEMPCFTRSTNFFIIFVVMLPGSEGEVAIEDVQLVVKE